MRQRLRAAFPAQVVQCRNCRSVLADSLSGCFSNQAVRVLCVGGAYRPRPACIDGTLGPAGLNCAPHPGASDVEVDEKADALSCTSGPDAYRCGARGGARKRAASAKTRVSGLP